MDRGFAEDVLNTDESIAEQWTGRVLPDRSRGGKRQCSWQRNVRVFGTFGKLLLGMMWPECLALIPLIHSFIQHCLRPSCFHYSFANASANSVPQQSGVASSGPEPSLIPNQLSLNT